MNTILERISKITIVVLLASISLIVGAQVFFRFVLNNPLPWPEELGRLFFIYLSFIGAGVTSLHDDHIRVDLLDHLVKNKTAIEIIELFREILILIVCIAIEIGAFKVLPRAAKQNLPATGLPKSLMMVAVVIGFIIVLIASIKKIYQIILFFKNKNNLQEDV